DAGSAPMMDMAMTTELALARRLARLTLACGAAVALATAAQAQDSQRLGYGGFGGPDASGPPSGQDNGQGAETQDGNAPARGDRERRRRTDVGAYLEVSQVLSADLSNGGDTLTYTSV